MIDDDIERRPIGDSDWVVVVTRGMMDNVNDGDTVVW